MMKKLLALALVLTLMLFAGVALAQSGRQAEKNVTVKVTVSSDTAVSVSFSVGHSAGLEFVSAAGGTKAPSTGDGSFIFGDNANVIGNASGSITFNISKDAAPGTYTFTPNITECKDKDGNATSCTVNVETLTVIECPHEITHDNVKQEPTCVDAGIKEVICDTCEKVIQTLPIEPIHPEGHTVVEDPAVAATCTEKGKTAGKHCSICGTVILKQEELPALAHHFVNGVCSVCSFADPEYGFTYSVSGTVATITSYSGKTGVTIPAKLGGADVKKIAANSFAGVKNVYIKTGITSIGDNAFPSGTVIHCYSNSYAYEWATARGYKVELLNPSKPTEIRTESSSITVNKGELINSPFIVTSEGSYPEPTYESSNDAVAKVDKKSGRITAISVGSAVITIHVGSDSAKVTVNVREAVTSFELNKTDITLVKGESFTLSAVNVKPAGATPVLTWTSGDTTYATVSAGGVVTAKVVGECVITAVDRDGIQAQCTVHIAEAVTEVKFAESVYTVEETVSSDHPKTVQLIANVKTDTNQFTNELVTFSSTDSSVAAVDQKGVVTGKKAGTVTITAKAANGKLATCKVNVTAHDHSKYAVDDPEVPATCEKDGLTKGSHCSDCGYVITKQVVVTKFGHDTSMGVLRENVVKPTCDKDGSYEEVLYCKRCAKELSRVKVTDPMTGHHLVTKPAIPATCTSVGYMESEYCDICYKVTKEAEPIGKLEHIFVKVDEVPATYTDEGTTAGEKCSVCGLIKSGCKVIPVKTRPDPKAINVSEAGPLEMPVSTVKTLTAALDPAEAKPGIVWSSSNPNVATVDQNGKIKAVSEGYAEIVVYSQAKSTVKTVIKVYVTVPEHTAYVTFTDGSEKIVHAGDAPFTLSVKQTPSTTVDTIVGFASSNSSVISVGADGKTLTVKKAGTSTITVTTSNGKNASIKITVHACTIKAAVEATCDKEGMSRGRKCNVKGCTLLPVEEPAPVPAKGHSSQLIPAVPATCSAGGKTFGVKCSVCGKFLITPTDTPKLPHTEVADAAVAATCTKDGLTVGSHCSVCGTVIVKQDVLKATGHTEGAPALDPAKHVDATCSAEGRDEEVVKCTVCNAELSRRTITLKKIAHTPVIIPGKAPTPTESGLSDGQKCSVCGEVLKAQEVIPPTGGKRLPGDVNGDGSVNGKDSVLLMQYLSGWGTGINKSNADVDGSSGVTGRDSVLLMQYLAGWGVTLK